VDTVVTITLSPSVDYSLEVDRLEPEEKLRTLLKETEPGGGGIQVARGLRRLGTRVEAVVTVGGSTGRALFALLENEGLNVRPVWVQPDTRPCFTLFVTSTQENFRLVARAQPITEYEYLPTLNRLREIETLPPYVVLSGSFPPGVPPEFVHQIAEVTTERQSNLLVDTSGPALRAALDAHVAVLKPSREELAGLVGADPADPAFDVGAAARQVVQGGVGAVVVSLGGEGAYVHSQAGDDVVITAPPVEVASTVGAGDSMVAGLVAGLSRGLPLVGSARLGVACGSGTCRHPGSQLFTSDDIHELLPQVSVRQGPPTHA
jgi:6-phosphofructokinase 2